MAFKQVYRQAHGLLWTELKGMGAPALYNRGGHERQSGGGLKYRDRTLKFDKE